MHENRVKAALRAGKTVVGVGLSIAVNPMVAKALAATGIDFLFIDNEHNLICPDNLRNVVQMARACGVSPIVRVQDTEYNLIANTLDAGADGVVVPRVTSTAQAERAVSYAKFPPTGVRGCGTTAPLDFNRQQGWDQALRRLNEQSLVVLQAESKEAIDSLEDILQVRGVDVVLVGPLDLSINLGVAGKLDDPKWTAAVERVIEICMAHQVPTGIMLGSPEALRPWWEKGMRFLVCGNDYVMIRDTASRNVGEIRSYAGSNCEQISE